MDGQYNQILNISKLPLSIGTVSLSKLLPSIGTLSLYRDNKSIDIPGT